jgi:hypothetical protein
VTDELGRAELLRIVGGEAWLGDDVEVALVVTSPHTRSRFIARRPSSEGAVDWYDVVARLEKENRGVRVRLRPDAP